MYKLRYHHRIPDDLARIGNPHKKILKKAVEEKLAADPLFFGKPLQFSLKGLRSMRVGDYRVIFQILNEEVFVVLIQHRATVYKNIEKRI
jgi:mRNA-degrading endonuclease RelE of RelBE toxin-antitoxin system